MKTHRAQSATSLPKAPREDADGRTQKYMLMMAVRLACIILMAVVTPYGWYTFVFAVGAIFLPYVAVIVANVGQDAPDTTAVNPERALEAPRPAPAAPVASDSPVVIRIAETSRIDPPRQSET